MLCAKGRASGTVQLVIGERQVVQNFRGNQPFIQEGLESPARFFELFVLIGGKALLESAGLGLTTVCEKR